MLGVAPFDWQLNDSYFVIAHFHYVIVGGILYGVFGFLYYWFPKAFGRMLNKKLGLWHFWLFTIGFHLTFDPQHFAGFLGMPRRIYTYQPGRGWEIWNFILDHRCCDPGLGCHLPGPQSLYGQRGKVRLPGTILGTPGRWNGPLHRRLRITILKPYCQREVRSRRPASGI